MKYQLAIERRENEGWSDFFEPRGGRLRLECCGCGLIHDVHVVGEPSATSPRTLIRFRRNLRATAARRRGRKA